MHIVYEAASETEEKVEDEEEAGAENEEKQKPE